MHPFIYRKRLSYVILLFAWIKIHTVQKTRAEAYSSQKSGR